MKPAASPAEDKASRPATVAFGQLPEPLWQPKPVPRIVGSSTAAENLEFEINRAAQFDSSVLLSGEAGSGREAVARAIHASGARRDRPFVAINCAALTSTLAESH